MNRTVTLIALLSLLLVACQAAPPPTEPPPAAFSVTRIETEPETLWNEETPVLAYWTGDDNFPLTVTRIWTECPPGFNCDPTPFVLEEEANPLEWERSCWCTGATCNATIETVSFYRIEDAAEQSIDTEPMPHTCRP